jgi:hypothetical protein
MSYAGAMLDRCNDKMSVVLMFSRTLPMAVFGLLLVLAGYGCLICVSCMAVLQPFWLIYLALLAFSGRMLAVFDVLRWFSLV